MVQKQQCVGVWAYISHNKGLGYLYINGGIVADVISIWMHAKYRDEFSTSLYNSFGTIATTTTDCKDLATQSVIWHT